MINTNFLKCSYGNFDVKVKYEILYYKFRNQSYQIPETAIHRCSSKKFFKNLANLREKNCAGVSFYKVVELKPATLFIERLRRCVFWYILPNLFRTTFMQSTPRHLLLRVVKKSSLFSFLISSIITSTFIIVIQIF